MKKCSHCKKSIEDDQNYCPNCGAPQNEDTVKEEKVDNKTYSSTSPSTQPKSKIAAGILGIFLGGFGVHNFYLGFTSKAVAQLLLTLVGWILCGIGPIVASVWGFVEGILILCGSITEDADGNTLTD